MDANKFGFQPDLSSMEKYLKENSTPSGNQDGPTWWSIPNGMSSVRILPPWDATGRVALTVYSHPIEYQGKSMKYKKYSWTCVNRTFGKPCNICEGLRSISESGVDISSWEPSRRTFYMNAIVMFDPNYDRDIKMGKKPEDCSGVAPGTHVLMRSPKTVYDWVLSQITNPMVGDITSITNGIDLYITKEGQGLGTTYTTTLSPNGRQPIPQEYLDKIDNLYNLDEIFATGFDQEQVDDLVLSLRKSSNALNGGAISNTVNQMSGFAPQNPYQQVPPMTAPASPQQFSAPPQFQQNVPPMPSVSPYGNQQVPTAVPPISNVSAVSSSSDKPSCFGKSYNASDVKCVTCSYEISCSQNCK